MAHLPIQCQNCGAKYKIPETFPGDFAKCKACGTKMDVNAARSAQSVEADAEPRAAAQHATGGTRKPRQSAEPKTGPHRKRGEQDSAPKRGRRATGAGSRRSHRGSKDDDEDGEDTERRGYQKKKDNTPLILGGALAVLAITVLIIVMMWDSGAEASPAKDSKVAAKTDEETAKKAEEEAAKKAEEEKAARAKAAEAAAKKKAANKKPKPVIKKAEDVMTAADVFKPSTLTKLPNAKDTTAEEVTAINEQLDLLREGGGLGFIRAPAKLKTIGAKMIPLAVNRLMTLDYSKAEDNQYACFICEAIKLITEFELAFDPARNIDEFTVKQGHANALKVKDLHFLTRKYWQTDKSVQEHIASRNKK